MNKIYSIFIFLIFSWTAKSQSPEFSVQISSDTVLMGNYFELEFSVMNGIGEFIAPGFNGLKILAGPNQSSTYSNMNGTVKQSMSYTYYMDADEIGEYIIPAATFKLKDGTKLYTPELKVVVIDNPNGLKQNPSIFDRRLSTPDKSSKKDLPVQKKTYKI